MISNISALDKSISIMLANALPHSPTFTFFFSFLSFQGLTIIFWFIILTFLIYKEEIKHRRFSLYFLLSIGTAFATTYIIKFLIQRTRPTPVVEMLTNLCPTDFSFPSGHTVTAFTAAFMLCFFDKKRAPLYLVLAGLISYSRIYLQCHYFFDVLGGLLVAWLVSYLFQKIYKKAFPDFLKNKKV